MGEPTPTQDNPSGNTPHMQDQQDSLQVDDPIIIDSPSPVTPTESYPLPLSLQKRRLSRNQGLHVQTDIKTPGRPSLVLSPTPYTQPRQNSTASTASLDHLSPPIDGRTHRSLSAYFSELQGPSSYDAPQYGSPTSSTIPSPALSAMIDITPLPSPIGSSFGSARWSLSGGSRRRSSAGSRSMQEDVARKNSLTFGRGSPRKSKNYGGLLPAAVEGAAANLGAPHPRDEGAPRSVSDFIPEALHNVRHRVVTLGSGPEDVRPPSSGMHREEYIAGKRGLIRDETKHLPSPPASNASAMDSEMDEDDDQFTEHGVEYYRAITIPDGRARRWRSIKVIGKGTFSKVFLATSQALPPGSFDEAQLDPSKLVAIKISEHGPAGGADEGRIKHSLDRELAILKSISHPSIVRLLAINEQSPQRTELVMTYSRGGDLFEFASQHRPLLRPDLVQRFFAELVDAVSYLHSQLIVHRDIKLENVLVNLPTSHLSPSALPHPQSHPAPLITLTDLGLSRRIPPPPASPLLTTRCGSEDYAAPELLLGQPYDGRATDAWALGVLLYALMEGRLPFDTPPGKPERSRNTHRIARCDWIWCRFGDEDGEWDAKAGAGWEGARDVVAGCLRKVGRGRWGVEEIKGKEWVRSGVEEGERMDVGV